MGRQATQLRIFCGFEESSLGERGGKHYSLRQPVIPGKSRLARVEAGFDQQLSYIIISYY